MSATLRLILWLETSPLFRLILHWKRLLIDIQLR
jgi:hypothetical protein